MVQELMEDIKAEMKALAKPGGCPSYPLLPPFLSSSLPPILLSFPSPSLPPSILLFAIRTIIIPARLGPFPVEKSRGKERRRNGQEKCVPAQNRMADGHPALLGGGARRCRDCEGEGSVGGGAGGTVAALT